MSRTRRAAGAGAALALCAALTGCQFLVSQIPDGPTPAPTAPPATGETQIQRQMRLDYAAAEKAYRTAVDESDRLVNVGASVPSARLRSVASGFYLKVTMNAAHYVRDGHYTATGSTVIRGVVDAGWQEKRIALTACEDVSNGRLVDSAGKKVKGTNRTPYYVQHLTVVKSGSTWKVTDVDTTQVTSFKGQPCAKA